MGGAIQRDAREGCMRYDPALSVAPRRICPYFYTRKTKDYDSIRKRRPSDHPVPATRLH